MTSLPIQQSFDALPIVYTALVHPRTAAEIAKDTGTTVRTVHQVISDYNRKGVAAIEIPGSGGRRKSYLSAETEQAFLSQLEPKAKRGELSTKAEIKLAFERRIGQPVHKSTIYRLLQRHEWGKRKPKPTHPKTDVEEQEHFKANFSLAVQ